MDESNNWIPSSERLMEFLNSLPRAKDGVEWTQQFKVALLKLLDDVDHVSVVINSLVGLSDEEQKWLFFFSREGNLDNDLHTYLGSINPPEYMTIMPGGSAAIRGTNGP
jgi:hypothetical protein